jgi:hypothetical protein
MQGYPGPPGGGQYQAAPPAGGGQYQVVTLDVGCGGTLDHNQISQTANQMSGQGFALIQVFIDIRSACGPLCPRRCAVLVFRRG